jgi:hypothetical protein
MLFRTEQPPAVASLERRRFGVRSCNDASPQDLTRPPRLLRRELDEMRSIRLTAAELSELVPELLS